MGELALSVGRFRRELRYDDWANREVLRHLLRESSPPANCLLLLAHIVGAQSEWLARLCGTKSTLGVWPKLTLDELEAQLPRLRDDWRRLIDDLDPLGLERTIHYTNSKGERWSSRVEDVLMHVLLHGVHHRGQITSALREAELTPPALDFIHATRRGLLD
jgi:uncharacterized damage-inducible protein DinB